jgi:hypothetical protein
MTQGEVGAGSKVNVNTKSPIVSRAPGERSGGKGIEIRGENYKGFDREKAPAYKDGIAARNVRSSALAGNSKVEKGGNSNAILSKSIGEEGNVSPIGSREINKGRKV